MRFDHLGESARAPRAVHLLTERAWLVEVVTPAESGRTARHAASVRLVLDGHLQPLRRPLAEPLAEVVAVAVIRAEEAREPGRDDDTAGVVAPRVRHARIEDRGGQSIARARAELVLCARLPCSRVATRLPLESAQQYSGFLDVVACPALAKARVDAAHNVCHGRHRWRWKWRRRRRARRWSRWRWQKR